MKKGTNTWKNKALRTVVMELVPLSITLSTSPVFLALCHLTFHIAFVVHCIILLCHLTYHIAFVASHLHIV